MNSLKHIAKEIRRRYEFLILTHTNPDGDAVGASLALALALKKLGKKAVFVSHDPVPQNLAYLPDLKNVRSEVSDLQPFDMVITLDCGDLNRVGKIHERLTEVPTIVNIDHHASNPCFGHFNYVDENASSSSEIIYRLIRELKADFDRDIASCIYTGVYSDTSSFRNANSTAESYAICGEMRSMGADPVLIAKNLYIMQPASKAVLFSLIAGSLKVEANGKIAGMVATLDSIKKAKVGPDAFEGFVDYPMSIEGVEASYLLREVHSSDGRTRIKGSLRTTENIDAVEVTSLFGGGGHRRASGFTTDGTIEEIRYKLINYLAERVSKSS